MKKFSFSKTYEAAEKQYNLGKGEYFKIKEGQNRIRLVSICLPHPSEYKGQQTFKWLCQVIDRVDGKVKPFFMPTTIYRSIDSLQMSDDYTFDGVPMPYDITIGAVGAGTKEVKYTVTPARANTDLTPEELKAIEEAPSVEELQEKVWENAKAEPKEQRVEEVGVEDRPITEADIPF